jgi:hypothetical protein
MILQHPMPCHSKMASRMASSSASADDCLPNVTDRTARSIECHCQSQNETSASSSSCHDDDELTLRPHHRSLMSNGCHWQGHCHMSLLCAESGSTCHIPSTDCTTRARGVCLADWALSRQLSELILVSNC